MGDPAAFLSYAHIDDHDGRVSALVTSIAVEIHVQTGRPFEVFQDRDDLAWGHAWKSRIDEGIDASTFLIAVMSPSFFASEECRRECERFLRREAELDRTDLILPIYYVEHGAPGASVTVDDPLAEALFARQFFDWRKLRLEPPGGHEHFQAIAQMVAAARGLLAARQPPETTGASPRAGAAAAAGEALHGDDKGEGPAAQTEVPAHVVDPTGAGDFTTIQAAIDHAAAGDRILVRPGTYDEGIVIEKALELVGDGPRDDIVVQAGDADGILLRTPWARVVNLTVRQAGGGRWFGIDIAQGRPEIGDCDISSTALSCVGIHSGADPRLHRCVVHDGAQAGVFVYEGGRGTIEDNEIVRNAFAGIEVQSQGDPLIRANRIQDGLAGGVFVSAGGRGTIEDNDIARNTLAGVEIANQGDPVVRRNRIRDGVDVGIIVHKSGRGTIEENDIFANTLTGLGVTAGGDPVVRRNRIHDGLQGGVLVAEEGRGTFEGNDIFANAFAGIEVRTGGDPVVRRNRVRDGAQSGVFVQENGRGTFDANEIRGNGLAGVWITSGGAPTLTGNRITGNAGAGVAAAEGGRGSASGNDLTGNGGGPFEISDDSDLERADNTE